MLTSPVLTFGTPTKGLEYSFRRKSYKLDIFSFYYDIEWINNTRKPVVWTSLTWEDDYMRRMWYPLEKFVEAEFNGKCLLYYILIYRNHCINSI
jgi:hypothetical protein